jgi:hypothetical protein
MTFSPMAIFKRDDRFEGVRRINIYLLRLVFILMFFVLGRDTWTHIFAHQGAWEPGNAMVCASGQHLPLWRAWESSAH